MRASSTLSLDAGMSTVSWAAWIPLRIRVRKSAMGSVMDMALPAALGHPGDVAVVRELAQTDTAQPELAIHRARPAAAAATTVLAGRVLGGGCLGHALGRLGHVRPPLKCRCPARRGLPRRRVLAPRASRSGPRPAGRRRPAS